MKKKKIIYCADLFCGGGGTSTGMIAAFQRVGIDFHLIGVNHWNIAIDTNRLNHPFEKLYCSTIQNVKPREAVPGGRLHFLWASPECTNHSRAKGGRPKDDQSRATAWDILKWAQELYIDRIYIENVVEFRDWGPIDSFGRPIKAKKGHTFQAFINALKSLGYTIDYQEMNAADFGAPTNRKRLIIQAVRGRNKIIWPSATHAKDPGLFGEQQWRSAKEIIDWSIPGQSIFARKKPLAENTLRRIESGIQKYWGTWATPFLIILRGTKSARPLTDPLPTISAGGIHAGLVEPFFIRYNSGEHRHQSIDDPISVLDCSNRYGLIEPLIIDMSHPKDTDFSRVSSGSEPIKTVTTRNNMAVIQPLFIPQQSAGTVKPISNPLPTISTAGAISIVEPFMIKFYGNEKGAESINDPIDTIPTKDRFGLVRGWIVEIGKEKYILDIRFRMLQPHELAAGMGFPPEYKFAGNKSEKIKQIGNAVSPKLSEALIYSALTV